MKKTEITREMRDKAAEIENLLFKLDDLKEEIKFYKEKVRLTTKEVDESESVIENMGSDFFRKIFGKSIMFDMDELEYEVKRILKDYEGE